MLYLERILEETLNIQIDLVKLEDLQLFIQLQVISRNKKVIFKDNYNTQKYLLEVDKWYKYEYPFWLKLQKELGYDIS